MNPTLYDVLVSNHCYTHGIGRVTNKDTLGKLESILKLGGLFSKDKLRNMGIIVEGKVSGNVRITNDSLISLFDPSTPGIEKSLLSSKASLRHPFATDVIFFMIDSSVEELLDGKRNQFDYTEINIKHSIPIEYFSGIIIPPNPELLKAVEKLLTKYSIELPILDFDGKLINSELKSRD